MCLCGYFSFIDFDAIHNLKVQRTVIKYRLFPFRPKEDTLIVQHFTADG